MEVKKTVKRGGFGLSACMLVLFLEVPCPGWHTAGHQLHARLAYEVLPKWEQEFLPPEVWERYWTEFCEYPDSRGPRRETFPPAEEALYLELDKEYLSLADEPGIIRDWHVRPEAPDLHQPRAMGVVFARLVKALRMRRLWEAGMWMGVIAHLYADDVAPAHCPILGGWSDFYRRGWLPLFTDEGLTTTDLIEPLHTLTFQMEQDEPVYRRLMAGYRPRMVGSTVAEAARVASRKPHELLGQALRRERACLEYAVGLRAPVGVEEKPIRREISFAYEVSVLQDRLASPEILALAAQGTQAMADLFHTAFMLALGRGVAKAGNSTEAKRGSLPPLQDYLCYSGLIQEAPFPAVGVMIHHPMQSGTMDGNIHFYTRALLATLRDHGIPYRVIQPDDLISADFSPRDYPVVIALPGRQAFWQTYHSPNDCLDALLGYVREGGSLLVSGGKPFDRPMDCVDGWWGLREPCDNVLKEAFTRLLEHQLPPGKLDELHLRKAPEAMGVLRHLPPRARIWGNIGNVWDFDRFPSRFRENVQELLGGQGRFMPLLYVGGPDPKQQVVGLGMVEYTSGLRGRIVFMPLYFLVPHLFTGQTHISAPEFFDFRMDPLPATFVADMISYCTSHPRG